MRKNTYMCAIFFTKLFFFRKIEATLDMFNLSGSKPF